MGYSWSRCDEDIYVACIPALFYEMNVNDELYIYPALQFLQRIIDKLGATGGEESLLNHRRN